MQPLMTFTNDLGNRFMPPIAVGIRSVDIVAPEPRRIRVYHLGDPIILKIEKTTDIRVVKAKCGDGAVERLG